MSDHVSNGWNGNRSSRRSTSARSPRAKRRSSGHQAGGLRVRESVAGERDRPPRVQVPPDDRLPCPRPASATGTGESARHLHQQPLARPRTGPGWQ